MYRFAIVVALVVSATGCKKDETASGAAQAPTACAGATQEGPIAWFEDDFTAALACATARDQPLVVDLWAPWCHTCLSMKSTVFRDPALARYGKAFTFVGIDTDRESNAAAVAKLPLSAWPTFYVLAPGDGAVLARFAGGASVAQFTAFLDAGAAARTAVDGAAKHLLAAERAIASKDLVAADRELTAAIAAAPASWVRTPDALVSLVHTKSKRSDHAGCLALGEERLDATGNAASATDFAGIALGCAAQLVKTEPDRVAAFRTRVIARLQALLADAAAPLSTDDRSDAMSYLRDTLTTVGDKPGAAVVAEQQKTLLESAITSAKDPVTASTYNYQLADVCIALGRPLDAVPLLEKSARALPDEYDPAARLGWVYLEAGKLDEAAQWTDTALGKVYGPRKARVLAQRANIAKKAGKLDDERRYRGDVVALWQSLPAEMQNAEALAKAKKDLEALAVAAP